MRLCRSVLCALALTIGPVPVAAQDLDVDAMIAAIDERSGNYDRLIDILQGTDATRSLAAFDVMLGTGDPTLAEIAITSALSSTDARLRARALWEVLIRKDAFTINVETEDLSQDARAALDSWIGAQHNRALIQKFPETQCINMRSSNDCYLGYILSVSGLRVEMAYQGWIEGQFELDAEGRLSGTVKNPDTGAVYRAAIDLR